MPRATVPIRTSNINDHTQIKNVLSAAYSVLLAGSYERGVLRVVLPFICEPNLDLVLSGTYFVAECATQGIIGCGGWTAAHPHTGIVVPETGHIRHFAVHPEQAGKGVGRQLFDACLAQAKGADIKSLESCATINAAKFYRALGFETIRREDVMIAGRHPFPSVIMTRPIGGGNPA